MPRTLAIFTDPNNKIHYVKIMDLNNEGESMNPPKYVTDICIDGHVTRFENIGDPIAVIGLVTAFMFEMAKILIAVDCSEEIRKLLTVIKTETFVVPSEIMKKVL